MKFVKIVSLCVVFAFTLAACSAGGVSDQVVPRKAPPARFTLISGETSSVAHIKGRPAVVIFWAMWCSYSKALVQKLNVLKREDSRYADAVIMAVSIDGNDKFDSYHEYLKDKGLTSISHAFSGNAELDEAFYSFGAKDLPIAFILDRDGVITAVGRDYKTVKKELDTVLFR